VVNLPGMKEGQLRLQWEVHRAIVAGDPLAARDAATAQLRHVEKLMERAGLIEPAGLNTDTAQEKERNL